MHQFAVQSPHLTEAQSANMLALNMTRVFSQAGPRRRSGLVATLAMAFAVSSWGGALPKIEPLPIHGDTAKTVVKQLESDHYVNIEVNDALSARLMDEYLDTLDPGRLFLYASDIREFQRKRQQLDDELKRGRLDTGFDIYNRYLQRISVRLEKTLRDLPQTVKDFDFTKDEYLELDRSEAAWPRDEKEADELWRKNIKNRVLSLRLAGKSNDDIVELLTKRYRNQLKRLQQSESEDVFQFYINALTSLYDPHTDYFSPRISKNFQINMSLKLEGIGAVLQSEDDYTKVVRLVPAGPADKQGQLQPSDRIVGVAEGKRGEMQDVVGWRLDDVVDLIRGPKGSVVRLEVIPSGAKTDDERREITIVRNEVKLEEQSAQKRMIEVERDGKVHKVGVIDVPAFYLDFEALRKGDPNYRSTTRDVKQLLDELLIEGAEGIVIDLRDNGGGSLAEANELTGLFIESGPTVQIRYANSWVKREGKRRHTPYYDGPLTVLINRMSASASEIFAAAIQDYQRGIIIGTQSFGKGTVQSINPMRHGQLKLTESKFYRISGESTQHRGVIPDIAFPAIYDTSNVGESALENALTWDTIAAVSHKHYYKLDEALPKLRQAHDSRAASNPDFAFLREQFHEIEKLNSLKRLSLNEAVRRSEREERRKLQLALENKRRVAKGLKALSSLDDDETTEEEAEPEVSAAEEAADEPDPLLLEASQILVDALPVYGSARVAEHSKPLIPQSPAGTGSQTARPE